MNTVIALSVILAFAIAIGGGVFWLISIFVRSFSHARESEDYHYPFRKNNYFLTDAERKFYYVLEQIAQENKLHVFAKVRLEDLLWLPDNEPNHFALRGKVKSRHIDFVICDYENVQPLLAIELDDWSHTIPGRQKSDSFKDRVLKDAGLPLLRFPVQSFYDKLEISQAIFQKLNG